MRQQNFKIPLVLFLIAVAVFTNSLGHDFVWDDTAAIRDNPFLVSPGAWWQCFGRDFGLEITRVPVGYYRPLVFLSYILNYAIGDWQPFVYHLTNILLHGLNTVLVFWLVKRLAGRRTGALAAVIFAAHPVHAESVAFIAGRSDLLCACFMLLSVLATIRSFEARHGAHWVWWIASSLAYIAALLSKEMAVALPGVLIAYGLVRRHRLRTLVRLCAPALILALAYLAFRFRFFPMAGLEHVGAFSFAALVRRAARLLFLYAAQQIFPVIPTLGAEIVTRHLWVDVIAVVFLVLLIAAAKPRGQATAALIWTGVLLAPVLWVNLFTRLDLTDRFAYVPSVGVCALAGVAAARCWNRYPLSRLVVIILLIAFGALSFVYGRMWRDAVTLWNASIAYHPQCGRCYFNLGCEYRKRGQPTEAVKMLQMAARLLPDDERRAWTYANMAYVLAEAGKDDLAIATARHSLKLLPQQIAFRLWFADLLAELGRHDEAIAEMETARESIPQEGRICLGLAREYLATRPPQVERARQAYERARALEAPRDQTIETSLTALSRVP